MFLRRKKLSKDQESMLAVLERTYELLKQSQESDWSPLTPIEVQKKLAPGIKRIAKGRKLRMLTRFKLSLEFDPTSTMQEIAMANGWYSEYLELADKLDALIEKV